jgi:hypothetical protein
VGIELCNNFIISIIIHGHQGFEVVPFQSVKSTIKLWFLHIHAICPMKSTHLLQHWGGLPEDDKVIVLKLKHTLKKEARAIQQC